MKTRIREMRIKKNMSLEELAKRAKISKRQIIRIEKEDTNPSADTLLLIAEALGTITSYLTYEVDEKTCVTA